MVTRGTVQNLTMRFMKITFVHGLNWTHVDAAFVAFFGIGYNMYNNKLRSIELLLEHHQKLKLRLNLSGLYLRFARFFWCKIHPWIFLTRILE